MSGWLKGRIADQITAQQDFLPAYNVGELVSGEQAVQELSNNQWLLALNNMSLVGWNQRKGQDTKSWGVRIKSQGATMQSITRLNCLDISGLSGGPNGKPVGFTPDANVFVQAHIVQNNPVSPTIVSWKMQTSEVKTTAPDVSPTQMQPLRGTINGGEMKPVNPFGGLGGGGLSVTGPNGQRISTGAAMVPSIEKYARGE